MNSNMSELLLKVSAYSSSRYKDNDMENAPLPDPVKDPSSGTSTYTTKLLQMTVLM